MAEPKTIYFLCSPGLGMMDNWLPVLHSMKTAQKDLSIICIIPKTQMVDQAEEGDINVLLSEEIFKSVFIVTHSGIWIETKSILNAKDLLSLSVVGKTWLRLMAKLKGPVGGRVRQMTRAVWRAIDQIRFAGKTFSLHSIRNSQSILLFDLFEETKSYSSEILMLFAGRRKFSLPHGVNVLTQPLDQKYFGSRSDGETTAFVFSKLEKEYFEKGYRLDEKDLRFIGVPKHNPNWVSYVRQRETQTLDWQDYVFVISRPVSNYLPYDRKKRAIEDIKKLFVDKLGMKIVVKRHPKEFSDGLFEKILGTSNLGTTWTLTRSHAFTVATHSKLAIAFYSSVVTDMVALGVPSIEYLDLRNIAEFDNDEALRDSTGEPVFSYRHQGLTLGASDSEQLSKHADSILKDRFSVISKLKSDYDRCFDNNVDALESITAEILNTLYNQQQTLR